MIKARHPTLFLGHSAKSQMSSGKRTSSSSGRRDAPSAPGATRRVIIERVKALDAGTPAEHTSIERMLAMALDGRLEKLMEIVGPLAEAKQPRMVDMHIKLIMVRVDAGQFTGIPAEDLALLRRCSKLAGDVAAVRDLDELVRLRRDSRAWLEPMRDNDFMLQSYFARAVRRCMAYQFGHLKEDAAEPAAADAAAMPTVAAPSSPKRSHDADAAEPAGKRISAEDGIVEDDSDSQ
jgi:pyruvate/2-oxoglutarate dehydrogenase complex dihydrolipoamide acyltransferase (E2) component